MANITRNVGNNAYYKGFLFEIVLVLGNKIMLSGSKESGRSTPFWVDERSLH